MQDTISIEPYRPSAQTVSVSGRHFVDDSGRVLDLRGANVSSSSKVPLRPCPPFHLHSQASYVGRPFPLAEARQHWRRLRSWGFTFMRITVTWEALEHSGPGQYDQEYLDYLRELLIGMNEEGVAAYVALHQDVFSRYCGGSGAPGWTVEAAGFDLGDDGDKLALAGAAFLDGIRGGRLQGERGLWPTGYQKLSCATMNTMFWGGETFTPAFKVANANGESVNIQEYLQSSLLRAVDKLVEAVGDLPGVLGFELMNEPHPGYIGRPNVHEWDYNTDLHLGESPSILQGFSMGAGHPTPNIPVYTRSFPFPTRHSSSVIGNPKGAKVWREDGPTKGECPFEREGVWRWSEQKKMAVALQQDYFSKDRKGRKINFYEDFYFPFIKKWEAVISKRQPGKCRMIAAIPNEYAPTWPESARPATNFVYAPHWYDLNAMFKKKFGFMTVNVQGLSRGMFFLKALYFGREGAKENYTLQIRNIVEKARAKLGEVPIVFGECGIPMDMNNEKAFRSGDFSWHERMMDSLISALEASLVGFNLWSFNPANNDDIGCDWNAEHFSWYSNERRDQVLQYKQENGEVVQGQEDLDAGARLLSVLVRPYAVATAGNPTQLFYNYQTSEFTYRFRSPLVPASDTDEASSTALPPTAQITEIFLPRRIYKQALTKHLLSPGGRIYFDWDAQRAYVWFVDPPIPGGSKPTADQTRARRIDFWIGVREANVRKWWQTLLLILVWFMAIALAMWLQKVDWAKERRMGYTPWAGAKFFASKW